MIDKFCTKMAVVTKNFFIIQKLQLLYYLISTLAPPMPAEPAAAPVPVIEQESVLDLSLQR